MAQLNITLNQDEILQLLSNDRDAAFKTLLENSLNSILKAESTEQLKAEPYERSNERTDSRNGSRNRNLTTRIGKITLCVPRHRNVPFETMIFDNYSRSEAALIATMAEMVVSGVSTRKVSKVMETLCGTSYSKSAVSDVCKDLDKAVDEFRNRPLTSRYPFVLVDATYFRVRSNNRVISKAFMIAYGLNDHGQREILGFNVYDKENNDTWYSFMKSLSDRGLHDILMITSDAHEGIINAIKKVFPNVPWQRCQFHFTKNILDKVPKKYQAGLRTELLDMFRSRTIKEARQKCNDIINDYQDIAESAMECLDSGFEEAMTVMVLPEYLRIYLRTSNYIERLNRELKRRSDAIGVFPNESSLLRLMGSVLIERHDQMNEMQSLFSFKTYNKLISSTVPKEFEVIAEEQRKLLVA